jgi:hypothetical protein
MAQPAPIAITNPVPRYSAATFQPNSPNNSTNATSLTIGAEIKNENVTPNGTPVVTNPMKSGTAEQEQKGVTIPNSAARTFPTDSRRPCKIARVRSGVKNERTIPTANTTSTSNISTFGVS